MNREKVEFLGSQGQKLAGLLEFPVNKNSIQYYALFAHCFTCGKDVAAASRISRELADQGIAVLRFDFTGLGSSDGDFSNTNFTSNVEDLVSAAKMLEEKYESPKLIIGHSLGGAAVLMAADKIKSLEAVATIAAPSTAQHVEHLFSGSIDTIEKEGEANVKIGFKEFAIKKQMIDDFDRYNSLEHITQLHKALIVFHSPVDEIVPIDEAANIFTAAKHPKSYISLDKSDHLLSSKEDASYVAKTLAAWAARYVYVDEREPLGMALDKGQVLVSELDHKFLQGLYADQHQLLADEPKDYDGTNLGPTPYALLLMGLGACTSMTLRMYAQFKKIPLDDVSVRLVHERVHAQDCSACTTEEKNKKIEHITRFIKLTGKDLTEDHKKSLLRIADRCPVHKTLESSPVINTEFEKE